MEELCPDAWLFNYSNPQAIICRAVNDYTNIKNAGLCHSVQGTASELAKYLGIPYDELSYWVAGINHIQSISQEGLSIVIIEFKLEVDGKVAAQDVREKVAAERANLQWLPQ